jgi:hypothetical protein
VDAEDLSAFRALLPAHQRPQAAERLRKMREARHDRRVLAALEDTPMVVLAADGEAIVHSRPWRLGFLGFGRGRSTEPVVSVARMTREPGDGGAGGPGQTGGEWTVYSVSTDRLSAVPDMYGYWHNKHPEGLVHLSDAAPDWLRPPPAADVETILRIVTALAGVREQEIAVAARIRQVCGGVDVFRERFPVDAEAGEALDRYWRSRPRPQLSADEEIELIRRGLGSDPQERMYRRCNQFVKHVGMRYIWGKTPVNAKAVELLYDASYHPEIAGDAVYHGLSVLGKDVPDYVLKRLVELALQNQRVDRILWGTNGRHQDMIKFLGPYRDHADPEIAHRAAMFKLALRGKIDYESWIREQRAARQVQALGADFGEVRRLLETGPSGTRRRLLTVVRQYGLADAFDRSFLPGLRLCAKDGDPIVREYSSGCLERLQTAAELRSPQSLARYLAMCNDDAAAIRQQAAIGLGKNFLWCPAPHDPKAVAAVLRLSHDPDHEVRHKAVYFGLSALPNKSPEVITRLIDMAMDERDANVHGRIAWGLRKCAAAQDLLAGRAQAGDHDAAELLAEIRKQQQ